MLPQPGGWKSEVQLGQGRASSRGSSSGGSFLPQPAPGGSRHPWACGCIPCLLPLSSHVCLCVCLLSLKKKPVIGFRATLIQDDLILQRPLTMSTKTLFPNKVPFTGAGGENLSVIAWDTIQPTTSTLVFFFK